MKDNVDKTDFIDVWEPTVFVESCQFHGFQIRLTDILLQPPRETKLCCDEVTLPVPQCQAKENMAEGYRKGRRYAQWIWRQVGRKGRNLDGCTDWLIRLSDHSGIFFLYCHWKGTRKNGLELPKIIWKWCAVQRSTQTKVDSSLFAHLLVWPIYSEWTNNTVFIRVSAAAPLLGFSRLLFRLQRIRRTLKAAELLSTKPSEPGFHTDSRIFHHPDIGPCWVCVI